MKLSQNDLNFACFLANKMFMDYLMASSLIPIEPESFSERWLQDHVQGIAPAMHRLVWKFFMINMISRNSVVGPEEIE